MEEANDEEKAGQEPEGGLTSDQSHFQVEWQYSNLE